MVRFLKFVLALGTFDWQNGNIHLIRKGVSTLALTTLQTPCRSKYTLS